MIITHKVTEISGQSVIYLYVELETRTEFAKEDFETGKKDSFLKRIREYILTNLKETKKAAVVLVINGVIVGSLTMATLYGLQQENILAGNNEINIAKENVEIYSEQGEVVKKLVPVIEEEQKKQDQAKNTALSDTNVATVNKPTVISKPATTTTSQSIQPTVKPVQQSSTTTTSKSATTTVKPVQTVTTTKPVSTTQTTQPIATQGQKVKLSNNGSVITLDLEEYVVGVVAAEMPAAFHTEALKAQAVAARTYAMKKTSKGVTLINSTANQVYYTTEQMKAKWGTSYNTYYTKVKNAVDSTKGQVLKYNGEYIEAQYYAISNGKSELPIYVWNTNYAYLQAVSSSWDANISAGRYNTTIPYTTLSTKLGVTVNKNTSIRILSRTKGDRIEKIQIGEKEFTGVGLRSILGLRSADFSIVQNDNSATISTVGYGHGVGMSQYGANGAAKAGLTYRQILTHYYTGVQIVVI